jgi:ribonuclease P protein component
MLPAANRLPKEEISPLLRHGTRIRSDIIEFIYKKTDSVPRFAFIVSASIDKRATARNRMRRTMSESVRHTLPYITSCDGIFIARGNFTARSQNEIEKSVMELLKSGRLMNNESGIMNNE